jgi:hypothetical protein
MGSSESLKPEVEKEANQTVLGQPLQENFFPLTALHLPGCWPKICEQCSVGMLWVRPVAIATGWESPGPWE